jgi:aspartate dehydrogenase
VNVHATIAMAGIGFDKTQSRIISDPSVNTNSHRICVDGEGFHFELFVSSFSTGGVTGKYTPYSACGSLNRILDGNHLFCFV